MENNTNNQTPSELSMSFADAIIDLGNTLIEAMSDSIPCGRGMAGNPACPSCVHKPQCVEAELIIARTYKNNIRVAAICKGGES